MKHLLLRFRPQLNNEQIEKPIPEKEKKSLQFVLFLFAQISIRLASD